MLLLFVLFVCFCIKIMEGINRVSTLSYSFLVGIWYSKLPSVHCKASEQWAKEKSKLEPLLFSLHQWTSIVWQSISFSHTYTLLTIRIQFIYMPKPKWRKTRRKWKQIQKKKKKDDDILCVAIKLFGVAIVCCFFQAILHHSSLLNAALQLCSCYTYSFLLVSIHARSPMRSTVYICLFRFHLEQNMCSGRVWIFIHTKM